MSDATVEVRFFAAAAEAAGVDTASLPAGSLAEVLAHAEAAAPDPARLSTVLERCSILVDGRQCTDDSEPLAPGSVIDVLPPFAGG